MNSREELFLRTLEDFAQRIASEDAYEVLGASALIRKLLIDSSPLVDQVNQKYRLKIEFEVMPQRSLPPSVPIPDFSSVQDGLNPDTSAPRGQ